MPLPVRRSKNPKMNAPVWAGTFIVAFIAIYNALSDLGLPAIVVAIIAAVVVLAVLIAQMFTKPNSESFKNRSAI